MWQCQAWEENLKILKLFKILMNMSLKAFGFSIFLYMSKKSWCFHQFPVSFSCRVQMNKFRRWQESRCSGDENSCLNFSWVFFKFSNLCELRGKSCICFSRVLLNCHVDVDDEQINFLIMHSMLHILRRRVNSAESWGGIFIHQRNVLISWKYLKCRIIEKFLKSCRKIITNYLCRLSHAFDMLENKIMCVQIFRSGSTS